MLRRLLADARGYTLGMVAAALIPLTAMVGSGVDMARAYTVQARLQSACDASALAGRRAMLQDRIDDKVTAETTKFFNFNFPQKMYDTAAFSPAVTRPAPGTVHIEANTTVPTAVMQLFGYQNIPVKAVCDASQNFINADIMLVLDVTGSMNCAPDQSGNSDCGGIEQGNSKIQALRDAVMALYDQLKPTQDFLQANGYRLRYGIVPYSQTVNVGKLLYENNPDNIQTVSTYKRYGCYYAGSCYVYYNSYTPSHNQLWFSKAWSGCIEERQTLVTAGAKPTAAELADTRMKDLNIDLIPDTNDSTSQWRPYDPDASGWPGSCPKEAAALQTYSARDDLLNYVNALKARGSTYHDIGMIWGARMLSSGGVFHASPQSWNGMRTNKYVIFLTDGAMAPTYEDYNAYGVEFFDRRITGGSGTNPIKLNDIPDPDANLVNRHNGRFTYACNAIRNMPAQVWVIALATALTDPLRNCANSPDQAATVANRDQLIAKFSQIGQDISELRLSL